MEIDDILGGSLDIIKNPFNKDSLDGIQIYMARNIFTRDFYFKGVVEFRNGNTQGKQTFEGENLVDVFVKVRDFCMNLK